MRLGDFLRVQGGYAFPSESFRADGVILVRISNISGSKLDFKPSIFLPRGYLAEFSEYKGEKGDSLIAMSGATVGKTAKVTERDLPFLINQRVGRFRILDESNLDKDYLYFLVSSEEIQREILIDSAGGAQPNISSADIERVEVNIPVISNQQKIANILATVDNLIEKTQALIDKYTAIKQGMMADLFTRGIDLSGTPETNPTYGQLRPPVEQAPELYKQTELGWIPKEWEVMTIGECCEVSNNLRKPISAEEREKIKGDYPYYGCTGILDYINEYRVDGKYVIIGEDGDHFLKFDRQEMTLLIDGKFNVNNHAHIISGSESCTTEWFHCFFVHRDLTYYLTRQGAGRFKLKKGTLLSMPMLVPSRLEQEELYKRYSTINCCQSTATINLDKYKNIKKGLMQDLLTGKVQVS